MQQLLTGQTRLPGFTGVWKEWPMGSLGATYGGLVGKTKEDFGVGEARNSFMAVMASTWVTGRSHLRVRVGDAERQNVVKAGDLLFNASCETPDELAMCAVAADLSRDTYLNSFCFGFRLSADDAADALFLAYLFRSGVGRRLMRTLAQGAIRYNLSKSQFRDVVVVLPPIDEQRAIVGVLDAIGAVIGALRGSHTKAKAVRQGMMQELLTGRTRLPVTEVAGMNNVGQHEQRHRIVSSNCSAISSATTTSATGNSARTTPTSRFSCWSRTSKARVRRIQIGKAVERAPQGRVARWRPRSVRGQPRRLRPAALRRQGQARRRRADRDGLADRLGQPRGQPLRHRRRGHGRWAAHQAPRHRALRQRHRAR